MLRYGLLAGACVTLIDGYPATPGDDTPTVPVFPFMDVQNQPDLAWIPHIYDERTLDATVANEMLEDFGRLLHNQPYTDLDRRYEDTDPGVAEIEIEPVSEPYISINAAIDVIDSFQIWLENTYTLRHPTFGFSVYNKTVPGAWVEMVNGALTGPRLDSSGVARPAKIEQNNVE